jgi:S-adenosylmethionine-diacylglycerol 3-amino-3-carboxypropyl transferase
MLPRPFADHIHDGLFQMLFHRSLLYNTCWEDPAVDRQALRLGPSDTVLVITSAGCNALDYALESPRAVWAVDFNPRQTALLELKTTAIRHLDYETFFDVFGRGRSRGFRQLYRRALRPHLSPAARRFWDRRCRWFEGHGWRNNFYWRGLAGLFARLIRDYCGCRPGLRRALLDLLDAPDLASQRRIYARRVEPALWSPAMEWFLRRSLTMCLLGIPSAQRQEIGDHRDALPLYIRDVLRHIFRDIPARTNYFWGVYIRGHYTETCCPRYLQRPSFDRLRRGLVDRIHPRTGSVTDFLRSAPEPISRFVLLDHMDWLSGNQPEALAEEWEQILDRAAPGARVIFRSAARRPRFLETLRVRRKGSAPRPLHDFLTFDPVTAETLSRQDRVGTYASFHIADINSG